jgi:superfamily II DNA/RNA helicase
MVCTDVLKQGVDLHLFCDAVIHYGIAWTAGDLEQRIGRVDRLGGLLSRRLLAHTGSAALAPRLAVQFPYLDGTLDKRQVRNVLYRKILSDLTLDLQKPTKEVDHISAANLGQHLNVVVPNGKLGSETEFFPDEVRFARDRIKQALNLPEGIG